MSLEALLEENTKSNLALVEMLGKNTQVLERVVAGQHAALEKLDSGAGKAASGRGRTKKEPEVEEKATAPTAEPEPAAESEDKGSSVAGILAGIKNEDGMKQYATAWLDKGGEAKTEGRKKRVEFLQSMAQHFGCEPKFGQLLEHKDQAVFFMERKDAGLDVDFGADYDFDGDPTQDGGAPSSSDSGSDFE